MSFQCEYVRCGKRACRSCPHGPYWYEYWREGPKIRKRYRGKKRPQFDHDGRRAFKRADVEQLDDILDRRRASLGLALKLLGFAAVPTLDELKTRWRKLSMELHPDRQTGDEKRFTRASAAYTFVKATI